MSFHRIPGADADTNVAYAYNSVGNLDNRSVFQEIDRPSRILAEHKSWNKK
jgi:hypothetical protein